MLEWLAVIALGMEIFFLGYLLWLIKGHADQLSQSITNVQNYITTTEATINKAVASAQAYVTNLEKKINDKFGQWL